MGLVTTLITLKNPQTPDMRRIEVEALGDTGCVYLCIPEQPRKEVTLDDGRKKMIPYVGPVEVRFKNRVGFGGAIVTGDQVLLGVIPTEDMDLVFIPGYGRQRTVNITCRLLNKKDQSGPLAARR